MTANFMPSDGFNAALVFLGMVWFAALSPETVTDVPSNIEKLIDRAPIQHVGIQHDEAAEHMLALVLLGEAAHSSNEELEAIIWVVFNRVASGIYGTTVEDVLMYQKNGVYAFTALDPKRANPRRNVWAKHLKKSKQYRRMRRIIYAAVEGGNYRHAGIEYYYHPEAMVPKGAVPRWARGAQQIEVGNARFFTRAEVQRAAKLRRRSAKTKL